MKVREFVIFYTRPISISIKYKYKYKYEVAYMSTGVKGTVMWHNV